MSREFIDAGIKLHVTVESKDALKKLEKLMMALWHTAKAQAREDEDLNVYSVESEIYERIQEIGERRSRKEHYRYGRP